MRPSAARILASTVLATVLVAPLTPVSAAPLPGRSSGTIGAAAVDPPETPPRRNTGDTVVHDPAIARTRTSWYVLSTGIEDPTGAHPGGVLLRSSRDGRHWRLRDTLPVPAWVIAAVPGVRNIWAPDVSRHGGLWYVYYAASTFGSNNSVIGLLTSPTLDPASPRYHWTDRGLVTRSQTGDTVNAIDPNLTVDAGGRAWLAYGSFWSGITMIRVELPSGKPVEATPVRYPLVDRHVPPNAVEAPFVVRHGGWYYLFAAFDFCCQGVNSTYRTVVGRSRSITGPYVDRTGRSLLAGGGSPFLDARGSMRGPGGASVTGATLAFHYYDAADNGAPHLGLGRLAYRGGWPVPVRVRISQPLDR
jgi:arabinan endo-1,5-alpha-L-arabinosidase